MSVDSVGSTSNHHLCVSTLCPLHVLSQEFGCLVVCALIVER